MRVAIVSDTHMPKGSRALPPECLRHMREADAILHAGDLCTLAVLEQLQALGPPVHAVCGNVDDDEVRRVLPPTREVDLGGVRVAMIHDAGAAAGRLRRMRRRVPDADAVVFGHSHVPLHEYDPQADLHLFNPGSPTERRAQPRHTMGIATIDGSDVGFRLVTLG